MEKKFNSLNYYGYVENTSFAPKKTEIAISQDDNIISVTDDGALLGTVKLDIDNETLSLIGKDGEIFSSVSLPAAAMIDSAEYDEDTQELVIVVKLADGTTQETRVSFASMLSDYAKKEDVDKNSQAIQNEASERADADAAFAQKDMEIDNALSALTEQDVKLDEALQGKADKTSVDEVVNNLNKKVDWTDISTEDNPNRKSIVLGNHDTLLGTTTSGDTYNLVMLSKWDTVDVGSSKIKLNMNTPKGERPTVQEAGQSGEEANKIAYVSDIQNGVYSLGEIESFNNLADRASAKGICDNQDNVFLTFKITASSGLESGFIVNTRYDKKISQALYWKQSFKPEMSRTLTISDDGSVDNPPFYPYTADKLYVDMVNGKSLFALTTSATSEEIQSALTDAIGDNTVLTAEQLDDCLKYGYYVMDSTLRTPIFIGWDGQGYTFTSVGLSSPKGQVSLSTITIMITDGVYSVKRDGESTTILTAANVSKDATIKQMSDTITELQQRIEALEAQLQA